MGRSSPAAAPQRFHRPEREERFQTNHAGVVRRLAWPGMT